MKKNIGYCGLDCEKCDAFLATVRNDDALRAKTAALWSRLNGVEILPEMIHCQGCRAEGAKTYFCENLCAVRQCAHAKNFDTCADCAEIKNCKAAGEIFAKRFITLRMAIQYRRMSDKPKFRGTVLG